LRAIVFSVPCSRTQSPKISIATDHRGLKVHVLDRLGLCVSVEVISSELDADTSLDGDPPDIETEKLCEGVMDVDMD